MKQSFSWWCVQNRGVDDARLLRAAQQIGYDAVELIGREKFGLALDAGLTIASHGGHGFIESGLNDPAHHDRIEREIEASLELASQYSIPNLIVFSGSRRPGLSDGEGAENTILGLRKVVAAAEQAGVTLILELLNSKIDHPGYQCDRTHWAAKVVQAVASPRVKMLYDIYHMQIMEGDLIRTITDHAGLIGHYHTAGNPGRRDLDDDQEIFYPAVFRAIAASGFAGYIGHEFVPKGDPIAALRFAYEMCAKSQLG